MVLKYFELNFLIILKIICSVCQECLHINLKTYNKEHPLNVLGKDMNVSYCEVQGWVLDLLELSLQMWVLRSGPLQL